MLFLLDAARLQSKVVQLVPSRFVTVLSNYKANRRAEVGRERRRVDNELFKTLLTTADDFLIIQIAERYDQARAEGGIARNFLFLLFPPQFSQLRSHHLAPLD